MPCAAALRHAGTGSIFAIETWNADAAVADPTSDAPGTSWSRVELTRVKHEFYRFVAAVDLTRQVQLVPDGSNLRVGRGVSKGGRVSEVGR